MSYEERVTTRTEETDRPGAPPVTTTTGDAASVTEQRVSRRASGNETARRLVVFLFGLIQGLIVVRILLLLLDAREANDLVAFLLNLSEIFVGPFEGILRTGALTARGSILDISAIVALVGWTILELIVLGLLGVFRREPGSA
jgi:uncharacterized protein YggT (Ycf19 family)